MEQRNLSGEMQDFRLNRLEENNTEVIRTSITKTVGVGKDFPDINSAAEWIHTIKQTAGHITILLDDGVHIFTDTPIISFEQVRFMSFLNKQVSIKSSSGIPANCSISASGTLGGFFGGMFSATNSVVSIDNVTFDVTLGGLLSTQPLSAIVGTNSSIQMINCITNGGMGVAAIGGSINVIDSVFDGCLIAVSTDTNASVVDTTISNSLMNGVTSNRARVVLDNVTFTANTADTNIPLNEIQYDGSYISTNDTALSFKV